MIPRLTAFFFVALAGVGVARATPPKPFLAGAAAVNITPAKFPVIVNGGFNSVVARGAKDPVYARALVLDDGTSRLAMVVVDSCMLPRVLLDKAKAMTSKSTGIAEDRVLISATHTHTAPSAMICLGADPDPEYVKVLPGLIARSIEEATRRLQPARIGWAVIQDTEHTHNRNWIHRPDRITKDPFGQPTVRAQMHPGYQNPDYIGPSGPVDAGMTILSVQSTEGRPVALLANYSMHYFGAAPLSADWCGVFSRRIGELIGAGEGFVGSMSQGTSGDLMWMDYSKPANKPTIEQFTEGIAQNALKAYQTVQYHSEVSLAMAERRLALGRRLPDEQRLAWARQIVSGMKNDVRKSQEEVYAYQQLWLVKNPTADLRLQAIRIGDFGITAIPNEVFAISGLKLKSLSPLQPTMNIELANGAEGYIPPPEQHALGGYNTWACNTAGLEVQAEPKIVEALVQLLEEVSGRTRRVPTDPEGDYVRAVLTSKPVAYWRMGTMAGQIESDISGHQRAGKYEPGVAFYLNGPQAPGFSSDQINRAAHFAGGRMLSAIELKRDAYTVEMWCWNGLPANARSIAGYVFSQGVDGDKQCGGDHLGIGGTYLKDNVGKFFVYNGNAKAHTLTGRTILAEKEWHYVAMTREGARIRVYLDGNAVPEIDGELEITRPRDASEVFIGGRCDRFANFEGKLDEVALYDRPLNADEIAGHYRVSGMKPPQSVAAYTTATPPLSPAESLKKVRVREGYEADLAAAEPLVFDPVAFDWDDKGRLWVVEMADYPLGMDGKGKQGGRVRILEDTDGDGRFDKATLFADGLNFPTGILCWRDGCLVTAAPDILFLKDSTGSGKADVQKKLFTGFLEGNQQLRVNGLRWGVDGWVYCANGGHTVNYGKDVAITSTLTGEKIQLGSRDFRFKPDTGTFDPLSGPSQFGRNRDAWGNWFGVQNSYPIWHYVLEDRYLRRNPHIAPPSPKVVMTSSNPPVYAVSGTQKRYHSFTDAGHFTSACSVNIYQDSLLFGETGVRHAFTCEPVSDLVQHFIVEDDGVTFKAHRAEGESDHDFFASEDRWCRPVMVRTGPDGAIWIADMYRYMIEHPQWLPQNGKDDFLPFYREGEDKGRVYRVYPKGKRPAPMKRMDVMGGAELASLLESSNGWLRDKAQMMMLWHADKSVVPALEQMVATSQSALARQQALGTLDGLGALKPQLLAKALRDPHAGVRIQALRFAETRQDAEIVKAAAKLADDLDPKVRLQLACSLGEWKGAVAGEALARLAVKDAGNDLIQAAVLSSAVPHLLALAAKASADPKMIREIVQMALAANRDEVILQLISPVLERATTGDAGAWKQSRTLLDLLRSKGSSLEQLAARYPSDNAWKAAQASRAKLMETARKEAVPTAADGNRAALYATLLMTDSHEQANAVSVLGQLIEPQYHLQPLVEYVGSLVQSGDARVPDYLVKDWKSRTPSDRAILLDAMMSREDWTRAMLDRVKTTVLSASDFDAQRQARLLKHPAKDIRKIASEMFGAIGNSSRAKVIEAFRTALTLQGDPAKGKAVFAQACVACHQLEGAGRALGPDLRSVVQHPPDKLLTSILDPSATIEPGFTAYFCELKSGEQLYGLVAGETGGSITFKLVDASTRQILRSDIKKLESSKASLMPDGLEALLTPQSLADLIAYLKVPK